MMTPAEHLAKGRRDIQSGYFLLKGKSSDKAGRDAYLAAFHASLAYIVALTGQEPKTHHGTHTRFASLVREKEQLPQHFVGFLTHAYTLKDIADYDAVRPVSATEAESALVQAQTMLDVVEALIRNDLSPAATES